ncbi:MAG: fructosamine kinase family protein [Zoogloeaceae bacterium]|nr:fructosamine kinase family protein [Rhodocyclaceae bacterium]MCP5235134.1 fructosamine kinase family protein [Zoogloeaceae bacterium]
MNAKPEALAGALEESIRDAVGNDFRLAGDPLPPVGGSGCVNGQDRKLFAKLMPAVDGARLDAEVDGLAAIAATGTIRTPAVIVRGEVGGVAWLVLEWLDLHPIADDATAVRAAEALAAMHRVEGERFGWRRDNFIGATPQANAESDNWSRFFALERLRPQFERAAANGHRGDLQKDGQRVVERLPALFLDQRPRPSLLHGDLWHGNIGALADGAPVIFDPACYHGDREADIAMSELFGGLPHAFYAGYRRQLPLSADYETRKQLYNLYHILNHLNLFGRGYLSQACRMASQLRQALGR